MKIETLDDLKEYLKRDNKVYLVPNNNEESTKVQRFLLDNDFSWKGNEKWIDVNVIGYYDIFFLVDSYYIMFSQSKDVLYKDTFDISKFLNLKQKSKFVEQLFENIL